MMKTGRASSAEDLGLTVAMYDTGANLAITNPKLAEMLSIPALKWPRPVPIRFADASDTLSTHYVELGPLLGRVTLVKNAPSTIITRQSLAANGMDVLL